VKPKGGGSRRSEDGGEEKPESPPAREVPAVANPGKVDRATAGMNASCEKLVKEIYESVAGMVF